MFYIYRWKEFIQDVTLEKASWYVEPFRESTLGSSEEDMDIDQGKIPPDFINMEATWYYKL